MGQIVHEGWLMKSPTKHFIFWRKTTWSRRYFVLTSGNLPGQCWLQYYYDSEKLKFRRQIDLEQCEQVDAYLSYTSRDSRVKYDWIFDIRLPNRKVACYLAAQSEQEMNEWVTVLCRACHLQKDDDPTIVAYDHGLYSLTDNDIHMQSPSPTRQLRSLVATPESDQQGGLVALKSGGMINTRNAKGYIPLIDCISGPPRPPKTAFLHKPEVTGTAGQTLQHQTEDDDAPPDYPPPPLPDTTTFDSMDNRSQISNTQSNDDVFGSNMSKDTLSLPLIHMRDQSNDSTVSLLSFASHFNTSGETTDATSENNNSATKSSSQKRPPHHQLIPSENNNDPFFGKDDCKVAEIGSSQKMGTLTRTGKAPMPLPEKKTFNNTKNANDNGRTMSCEDLESMVVKSEIAFKFDKPPTLPRIVKRRTQLTPQELTPTAAREFRLSTSPTQVQSAFESEDVYRNVPIPTSATKSPPPPVDRSLKPARFRTVSQSSSAANSHQHQQPSPYLPTRLPRQLRTSPAASTAHSSGGVPVGGERPVVIDLSRKQSFTRKREAANNQAQQASNSQYNKPGITVEEGENFEIEYTEMSVNSIPTTIGSGTSPIPLPRQRITKAADSTKSNADLHQGHDASAKMSYVFISEDKTKALRITKNQQDRLYNKGASLLPENEAKRPSPLPRHTVGPR